MIVKISFFLSVVLCFYSGFLLSQNLSDGLLVNDLSNRPMQEIPKPDYLDKVTDPSFGTTIRRITDTDEGEVIVPMYSTVQAWNSDESFMILYHQTLSTHILLNGKTYQHIRNLEDIQPADIEQIFWDFDDPDFFYYLDKTTADFIKYNVQTQIKEVIVNLASISNCTDGISMGNDIQMMSWDSNVITFRCGNQSSFAYKISSMELIRIDINLLDYTAPAASPNGLLFYHKNSVYDEKGDIFLELNKTSVEHSCIGKLSNGNDALFNIAFSEGPHGGCIGDIIAHDLTTGNCFSIISQSQGYDYPQSGTHISSLAHKNSEGGWIAASMIGYNQDGQSLLDQELVIAKGDTENFIVCRIGHHRSDEDEFDYWGEPHPVISPSGTRVLFGSDWSGASDGFSVDSYVVELPTYKLSTNSTELNLGTTPSKVIPNPMNANALIHFKNPNKRTVIVQTYTIDGKLLEENKTTSDYYAIDGTHLKSGLYFYTITGLQDRIENGFFIKE